MNGGTASPAEGALDVQLAKLERNIDALAHNGTVRSKDCGNCYPRQCIACVNGKSDEPPYKPIGDLNCAINQKAKNERTGKNTWYCDCCSGV